MTSPTHRRQAADQSGATDSPAELLDRLTDTWGRGDAAGYAALFTPDADYVTYDGTHLRGRDEIRNAHQPLFDKFLRGSSLHWSQSEMRDVTPDLTLLTARGAVIMRWQRRPKPRRKRMSTITLLAVRDGDGRWLLTSFQNTRYRPFAESLIGRIVTRKSAGT
ncbi:SgcJ/EcaC family oxidoreductase [Nakamurella lactea]|uniref:SgcJ/EcaC family oxidoreductase n=1 Tax=Nakamurella lactea TaxID=459515 RepID=UPI0004168CD2|nr:SgcJ/EcaC family oxidoreductase [Nakamurella lactea]